MKSYELTPAALRALKKIREDIDFEDGPTLLDDVLGVLHLLANLRHEDQQLCLELKAIPPAARASLSLAIRAARWRGL
jgi:hypothetical protein